MKKTTLFSLLTMMLLSFSGNVLAEELFYTLWTVPFTTGSNHTNYNDYFDDEHDGIVWNAPGNQSLDGKWRIGGKSLDKVDRTITSKTAMGSAISRVVFNHAGTSNASFTVNSLTLTVASDVDYSDVIDEVVLTPTISNGTAGEVEFTPTTTSTEWPTDAYYKFTINVTNSNSKNAGLDVTSIEFYAPGAGGSGTTVAKPVITPESGIYTAAQEVTITAAEGCTIYYTTDGTAPSNQSTQYTAAFTVDTDCIVKAIAYDADGNSSAVAEADYQFLTAVPSIGRLCALTPESGSREVLVDFNNWIVTGVKGSQVYFTDGANGILLYQKSHGFELGDQLTGTATFNLTTYNDAPEITGLSATTEGVTVTKNATATPQSVSISSLQKDMQGCLITLKGVTFDGTHFVDADGAKIMPYDTFSTGYTLSSGTVYDATGVAIWFKPKSGDGYWEIAPRTADEFVEATSGVATPVINPAGGTFAEAQTVTITAEEGLVISYTTDGTDPYESATAVLTESNSVEIEVSSDCTVKAVAIDPTGAPSVVATAEFTFISATAIPTIARLCAAAPAEGETEVLVDINNWIVTGVKGGQVFLTDGANGIVNYKSGHGFEVGDKLNGTAVVTLTTFNECAEITSLTATTEGITVEKNATATPQAVAIADLQKDMQGCLITMEGVVYDGSNFVDGDDNTITPYDTFGAKYELIEGQTYNVTGVAIWFPKNQVWEIAPRTADEFQLVTTKEMPVSSWSVEEEVVDIHGRSEAIFTTTSDGVVTYSSSNEEVATIDADGVITLVGKGVTEITASVAESESYLPDSKSFTLTVTKDGYADATFAYNDEDIQGQGASDVGAEITATRGEGALTLYANRAYAKLNDTHIKFYGSNESNGPSYVQLSVIDGYAISKIVMTATGDTYIREWVDQFGAKPTIEGATATWEGMQNKVVLTNLASGQARIKTIDVTFIKLQDTGKTITISEAGLATFCNDVKAVLSGAEQFAIAGAIFGNEGAVLKVDTLTSSVPANTGVLLMGAPGEYKVYTHPDLVETVPPANMLVGVLADTEAPVGSYVLQQQDAVGFFEVVETSPVTVPAGHAYLSMPGVAGVPAFFFTEEDYVTGIYKVQTAEENAAIYNIAGQRLGKMQRGINIVGGKKVLK